MLFRFGQPHAAHECQQVLVKIECRDARRWFDEEASDDTCAEDTGQQDRALQGILAPPEQSEHKIEEQFVVQRPAEFEDRAPIAWVTRCGGGYEEQRFDEIAHIRNRRLEQ